MEELSKPENLQKAQSYVDFVKNNLEPLAEHLKVSVEWLWNILVMQARVEAIVYLLILVGMFMTSASLSIIFFKNIKKARFGSGYSTKEVDWDTWYDDRKNYDVGVSDRNATNTQGYIVYVTGIGLALMILISTVTAGSTLKIIVTGLVNPEFRAIEKIVEYAKPAVKNNQGN